MTMPPQDGGESVDRLLRDFAALFRQSGIETPDLDARLLLGQAMDEPRLSATLHGIMPASQAAIVAMNGFARRRLSGEPVSRILGRREFWGLDFALSPETLVPRPDSESLVEAALAILGRNAQTPLTILDMGTGSGCLLIALLHECAQATGVGIDLSHSALGMARQNASAAGVGPRAMWLNGRWGEALSTRVDLILSNPPYIETGEMAGLAAEVRNHDPALALDGGPDGLDAYRALALCLPRLLKPCGHAVLELGQGQMRPVCALMEQAGLEVKGSRKDLGGHNRALILAFA